MVASYYLPLNVALGYQMKTCICLVLLIASCIGNAVEIKPFPPSKITTAQWQEYFEQVNNEFGDTQQVFERQNLVQFSDDEKRATIAFTTDEHPAHPAWVTQYVTYDEDGIYISYVGYYAGEEEPFAKLIKDTQRLSKNVKERVLKKHID